MKSTTLRRSNITKEKVAMMEALNRYNREHQEEDFYRRQTKNRELDALWQNFGVKQPQKAEKAPQVYFVIGLIFGVIITLLITTFISILINISAPKDEVVVPKVKQTATDNGKFRFIPADNAKTPATPAVINEEYTVKEGDTLESIVIRFYGSFNMNKVTLIQEANKMANPNALSIGQKLIIPINKG